MYRVHALPARTPALARAPLLPDAGCGRESETVARCATLGRSQDVCKGARFTVEGERCVVSS